MFGDRHRSRLLARIAPLFYSDFTWVLIHATTMQRLTARFLLLFALAGTLVPLALAATAAPPHACCIRKAAHPCHGASLEADRRIVRGLGCCNHDCCLAVTTSQWAHAAQSLLSASVPQVDAHVDQARTGSPATELLASQSTRAPPQISIA